MFGKEIYIQLREQLKKHVDSGIILFPGNAQSSMNYKDNWSSFRQDSSFLYFFGFDKPDLATLIDIDSDSTILFGNDLVWKGPQDSMQAQAAKAGIAALKPANALEQALKNAQAKKQKIYFLPPYRPEHVLQLHHLLGLSVTGYNT